MEEFDVVILGAGSAGYVAAMRAADLGKKVLIIERRDIGGTCLNRGCIPTKAILRAADIYREAHESKVFGITIDNITYDPSGIKSWKETVVKKLVSGVDFLLKARKVVVMKGMGTLVDRNVIEVETVNGKETYKGKDIIIATGSEPAMIPAFKIDHLNVLTSDDALELREYPEEMIIVGAGAIGMEFATFFNSFGIKVTVIEMMENVIPTLKDKRLTNLVQRIYMKKGIDFKLGLKIENIDIREGRVYLTLGNGETLETEKVLVSIGRKLNSDNIGLEKLGINTDKGRIVVNEYLNTNVEHHYAIGDIIGGLLLAHKAMKEGEVVAEIVAGKQTKMNYSVVPWAIFTTPEVATVGFTEEEAKENGIEVITGEFPFAANGKSISMNSTDGLVKLVAERKSNEIVGAQIVGPDASIMIAELALAIKNNLTLKDVGDAIHTHPTLSEAVMEASKAALFEAVHIVNKPR